MKRSVVIYNVCSLNGKDNSPTYCEALDTIVHQHALGELVISGCMALPQVKETLQAKYADKANFIWIDESLPLNVTFNKAALMAEELLGPFENFVYVAADVFMRDPATKQTHNDELGRLLKSMEYGPFGMMMPLMENDTGYHLWGAWELHLNTINVLPVGRAVNGHCVVISRKLLENYGGLLPDVFANHTSESVWSFLCAALNMKLAISGYVKFDNLVSLDGPSKGWMHQFLFHSPKTIEEICDEGKDLGFGWEECNPTIGLLHQHCKYDDNGYAKDARLREFIRDNLYVQKEKFDYKNVPSVWVPRQIR